MSMHRKFSKICVYFQKKKKIVKLNTIGAQKIRDCLSSYFVKKIIFLQFLVINTF